MKPTVRKCVPEDLGKLTRISRQTFCDAFEAANDPEDFNHYLNTALSSETLLKELNNPDTAFYFVIDEGQLVAYFKLNENTAQTDLKSGKSMEVERIYVVQGHQGKKIGNFMMQEIRKIAEGKGKEFLWLGVWEHNSSAIRFYERLGYTKFGMHPYYIGKDRQMDWLMKLNIPTLSPKAGL